MSIRYDPLLARALARALRERLDGVRVRAVWFQYEHEQVRLFTDAGVLVVRLVSGNESPAVRFLPAEEPPEEARRIPLRVHGVETVPDERILTVRGHRFRGSSGTHGLVLELRPGDANVAFTEDEDDIVRHLLVTRKARGREWRSGHPYPFPPPSDRLGAVTPPTVGEWEGRLGEDEDARGALLRGIAYTSPINADWILEPDGAAEQLDRWRELTEESHGVVMLPDAQPYPHPLGHSDAESIVLLEFLTEGPEADEGARRRDLVSRLEDRIERARRRREALARQLEEAPEPEPIRRKGDLLLARLHEVPRGVEEVELADFEGESVTIELDPTLAPDENAAAYYDEAGRAERAREKLPGLMEEAEEARARWTTLLERLRAGEIDAGQVEEALPEKQDSSGSPGDGSSEPYRRFQSSGGIEIRVGRGARRNDHLTFHHSRPDDVWMHARHAAGAHVVLRWAEEDAPPARDLHEAAVLAALHSKARTSGSVPVDWTRRKYVRKPKGAAPGAVLVDRQQTVFVEPDPDVADRLAVDEE